MTFRRAAWITLGGVSLGLGAIGIVVPLLPTTPFILLAAFCFARSSDRWHAWLLNHRVFGPMIENWRAHGAIGRRVKLASVASMIAVLLISVAFKAPPLVLALQALALTASAMFVLSRPLPPRS